MSKVYIVNMLCPDDEDTTQIVGVYAHKQAAQEAVTELAEQELDASVETWDIA
jgi:hypothetical protein